MKIGYFKMTDEQMKELKDVFDAADNAAEEGKTGLLLANPRDPRDGKRSSVFFVPAGGFAECLIAILLRLHEEQIHGPECEDYKKALEDAVHYGDSN